MARPRRRSRNRTSPSLFPFLSVLACVIGALTLIIAATATSQIASGGVDIERYERLEAEIADGRRRLSQLESLDRENAELTASLAAAREEAARLEAEKARIADASQSFAALRATLRETEARVAALESQRVTVEREGASVRGRLAERRRQVANAPIKLRPSGTGYGLAPHFVECKKDGIVLFESPDWLGHRVPLSRIRTSPEYQRFLRRVSFREAGSVIFLIRRGGVDAYEEAFRRARQQRVRSGEMPIVGPGELDFSAVDGA